MYRILYVDDEPRLLETGKSYLERSGELTVDTGTNAPAGLALLASCRFDAVVSDYQMPGMDGIGFLQAVRESGNPVPFILLTARGCEDVAIRALNGGADFYLKKDGDFEELFSLLYRRITEIVRQHQERQIPVLANRKLRLLSSVTRHDISNQLTALQNFLSFLDLEPSGTSWRRHLDRASESADRIASIIRFNREYEEIGVKAPVWHDCRTLVERVTGRIPSWAVRAINGIPPGIEIFADPLIERALYALADNAVRHGGRITTLRFFIQQTGSDPVLVCEDDGWGVPPAEKRKIFERGFGKNTGMGLFLAREILAITGITIAENGEPGNGARFEMTVPPDAFRRGEGKTRITAHAVHAGTFSPVQRECALACVAADARSLPLPQGPGARG